MGEELQIVQHEIKPTKADTEEFIALLGSKNLLLRRKAAEALGEIKDERAVEPLIKALDDPFVNVSWIAAKSLGMIGDKRAVEPLIERLKAEDKWLRIGAAWALGTLGDPRATEPLTSLSSTIKNMMSVRLQHGPSE
jgi:HEAT repeat protein